MCSKLIGEATKLLPQFFVSFFMFLYFISWNLLFRTLGLLFRYSLCSISGFEISDLKYKENQDYSAPNILPVIASILSCLTSGGIPVDTVTIHVLCFNTAFSTNTYECSCSRYFSTICFIVSSLIPMQPNDIISICQHKLYVTILWDINSYFVY